jgi:hypothetical protein
LAPQIRSRQLACSPLHGVDPCGGQAADGVLIDYAEAREYEWIGTAQIG